MTIDLILGTAGHIDHGKTSLIRALTGIDTDRLPEEKRRGITIDLGFALLDLPPYRLGIVDCPGHERFVRNMLAGTTGIDLALLVVAADDSVNAQTREHLDILRQLDLRGGVIALTKCDLAHGERLAQVEQEIRGLVKESPLATAAIVPTSVVSGSGLDELRAALSEAAGRTAARPSPAAAPPFRLPIDRAFAVAGHGTVVTGSVSSGHVRIGDLLAIEPGGISVRVRGLHNHDRVVDELHRGQRGAINLAGIHHDQIRRGQELCAPGSLVPARTLTARLRLLAGAPPLKHRSRVRLHVGTAEVLAAVRLLGCDRLNEAESALVQFDLAEPAVTTWNQPFVVRRESPMQTLGGGRILDPKAARIRRFDETLLEQLERLESASALERAGASLYLAATAGWELSHLPRLAGVTEGERIRQELLARQELLELPAGPGTVVRIHRQVVGQLAERVAAVLKEMHDRQPLKAAFTVDELSPQLAGLEPALRDAALEHLKRSRRVEASPQGVALAGRGPRLSRGEQQLLDQLLEWFRAAGINAPSQADCMSRAKKNKDALKPLLDLAVGSGQLVAIGPDYWLHDAVEAEARQKVRSALAGGKSLTVSQIRELLGTTRKYAVPLCEYWDRVGFTVRRGDQRTLKS